MAEAHSAVAFSFQVTHDGVSVSYDQELLRNIWHAVTRGYKRRVARFKNDFRTGIYPTSPATLLFTCCLVMGLYLSRVCDPSLGAIRWVQTHLLKFLLGEGYISLMLSAVMVSVVVWFLLIQLMRYGMKLLLEYKGWMFEPRGKPSLATRIWFKIVELMGRTEPMLHSFQGALPRLPLPSLDHTLQRHLESVRPIVDDERYEEMVRLTEEFRKTIGPRCQWWLWLKSIFSSNYVTDWWEEYVYLRGRDPIMINSSYYGMDTARFQPTKLPAARAANIVYSAMTFRRQLERQEVKPIMVPGTSVPLCSIQYERVFNTCRIPGEECDTIRHWDDSRHVAVLCRGCWYQLPVHNGVRLYKPAELELAFQEILEREPDPAEGEAHLGALTAGKRQPWAEARRRHFTHGVNKNSLHAIERSAFVLVFDDDEYCYDKDDPTKLDKWAHAMMHGKVYNRWYDKTFNFVVSKNAKSGINGEHSWADAPIMGHCLEFCLIYEVMDLGYDQDGHTIGLPETTPPTPKRLQWQLNEECREVIESQYRIGRALAEDLEMALLMFEEYGKGFMKRQQLSPDAYFQMALQLTYFKDQGRFCFTYEASMTRLYREGRTETVRVVTKESCDFVRAMLDKNATWAERRELLETAARVHQGAYKRAMCGQGFDRHLFALYVVSRYLELESPFLQKVIKEPWMLSTSQTPHQQTNLINLNKNPQFISCGGGFGPVTDRGYGVSYIIGGDSLVSFHISSKRSADNTNSARFRQNLVDSLREMRKIYEPAENGTA